MTDILELCARAICRANALHSAIGSDPEAVECQVENGWDMWLPEAHACLTALAKNVSEGMLEAGASEPLNMDHDIGGAAALRAFKAMINAAIGNKS